jgi:hypothetical protein
MTSVDGLKRRSPTDDLHGVNETVWPPVTYSNQHSALSPSQTVLRRQTPYVDNAQTVPII